MTQPVCAVIGVGPGNGASFARRFDAAGSHVALLARSTDYTSQLARDLDHARPFQCDAGQPAELAGALEAVAAEMGPISNLIYNAGAGVWGTLDEIGPDEMESCWRVNALGAMVAAKQVAPAMRKAGAGNIVLIGATASRRGGARFTAFASAKAAQRSLAESMARHLWPDGIHVSLLIIDGVVDTPRTRKMMPDKPNDFFLAPDDIAETVFDVCQQPRSAWSFEVEVRPYAERW